MSTEDCQQFDNPVFCLLYHQNKVFIPFFPMKCMCVFICTSHLYTDFISLYLYIIWHAMNNNRIAMNTDRVESADVRVFECEPICTCFSYSCGALYTLFLILLKFEKFRTILSSVRSLLLRWAHGISSLLFYTSLHLIPLLCVLSEGLLQLTLAVILESKFC